MNDTALQRDCLHALTLRGDCRSVAFTSNLESSVSFQPVPGWCWHLPFRSLCLLLPLPFVSVAMYRLWLPSLHPTWGLDFWKVEVDFTSSGVHVLHDRTTEKGLKCHIYSMYTLHNYQCSCLPQKPSSCDSAESGLCGWPCFLCRDGGQASKCIHGAKASRSGLH